MLRKISLILLCFVAYGCVRASTSMIDQRTAIISAHGSAFNSLPDVQQKAFVQAATVTRQRGFKYFVILNSENTTQRDKVFIPGQTTSNTTISGFGNTAYATTTTSTTPATAVNVVKPGQDMMIRMFKEGETSAAAPGVWDADSILAANPTKP